MRFPASLLALLTFISPLAILVHAQSGPSEWKISPFNPSALPMAVRTPYLNTWLQQGNNPANVGNIWSKLWTLGVSLLSLSLHPLWCVQARTWPTCSAEVDWGVDLSFDHPISLLVFLLNPICHELIVTLSSLPACHGLVCVRGGRWNRLPCPR